jgi:hypothetical protein
MQYPGWIAFDTRVNIFTPLTFINDHQYPVCVARYDWPGLYLCLVQWPIACFDLFTIDLCCLTSAVSRYPRFLGTAMGFCVGLLQKLLIMQK